MSILYKRSKEGKQLSHRLSGATQFELLRIIRAYRKAGKPMTYADLFAHLIYSKGMSKNNLYQYINN